MAEYSEHYNKKRYHRKRIDGLCDVEKGQIIELAPIEFSIWISPIPRTALVGKTRTQFCRNTDIIYSCSEDKSESQKRQYESWLHCAEMKGMCLKRKKIRAAQNRTAWRCAACELSEKKSEPSKILQKLY